MFLSILMSIHCIEHDDIMIYGTKTTAAYSAVQVSISQLCSSGEYNFILHIDKNKQLTLDLQRIAPLHGLIRVHSGIYQKCLLSTLGVPYNSLMFLCHMDWVLLSYLTYVISSSLGLSIFQVYMVRCPSLWAAEWTNLLPGLEKQMQQCSIALDWTVSDREASDVNKTHISLILISQRLVQDLVNGVFLFFHHKIKIEN